MEFVDTSKYEQYEKQEGDFVDPNDPSVIAALEAADPTLVPGAPALEATVPPDEETR